MKLDRRNFIKLLSLSGLGFLVDGLFNNLYSNSLQPREAPFTPNLDELDKNGLHFCWIGHSTYLINFYGIKILTDPVFSHRIGPYALITNLGLKRIVAPSIKPEKIPKPDLIIISHAHFDHLDYPTLKYFSTKYPHQITVVTSFGTKDIFDDLPFKEIIEVDWKEKFYFKNLEIEGIQVKHFGWRYPWEKDRSKGFKDGRSYNGYILRMNGKKVLFAGDTPYSKLFNEYKIEKIDVAIFPIGAYKPWYFTHCNPEEALQMADEIDAKYFLPMHARSFPHGREPFDEPTKWLKTSAPKYKTQVKIFEVGQTFSLT